MPIAPAAFMSYVRLDDQHDDGQLTEFRERLSAEIRVQTGQEFPIFQDRNDIAWGQNWQTRINETLDAVTLLIPIITPSFFRSHACRDETERFLAREQQLDRQDLVLPVYYVSTREFDDPEIQEADELARILAFRQHTDWRELRFEPFTSPVVRKALAQLATRMRDTFWQDPPAQPSHHRGSRPTVAQRTGGKATPSETAATARAVAKTEPPTHVVDAHDRGDYTTISAAIQAARPGDRILVRPGLYQEGLVIDKPLEILGDGPVADIEIRARDSHVMLFKANIGRIANLTLRQVGSEGGEWHGVDIIQGRLDLEGCDISSETWACVVIRNGADPRLRRNRIHDSNQGGVWIHDDGLGTLEDNEITDNAYSGVEVKTGANPTLRRNQIHHNEQTGVFLSKDGLGTFEDNDITDNGLSGVAAINGSNPTVRRNRINRNRGWGIRVLENSGGVFENNDLTGNTRGPWEIDLESRPNVKRKGNRGSNKSASPVTQQAP